MKILLARRLAVAAVAVSAAAAGVTIAAPAASAAPVLSVAYAASGSSLVAKPNATVALGPTTLTTNLNADGTFTGTLPLPPTSAAFKVIGFVPATATVSFIPVGSVTGRIFSNPTPQVTSTATYYLKLTNVKLAGIPTFVGDNCQTSAPVPINVATPAGQSFNILSGGTVTGSYTIGNFANCGLTTALINVLVPGPNNTVTLTLSDAVRVG